MQSLSKNNVIMIRDVFNIQVEEIARYLGHSTMVVNDKCSKIEKKRILKNSTMSHLNIDFVITTFYLMFCIWKISKWWISVIYIRFVYGWCCIVCGMYALVRKYRRYSRYARIQMFNYARQRNNPGIKSHLKVPKPKWNAAEQ